MTARHHALSAHARADGPGQLGLFRHPVIHEAVPEAIAATAERLFPGAVVLPKTELSGHRGYAVVRCRAGLSDRLADGQSPMLDRATLSMWEMLAVAGGLAPAAPLQIVGFIAAAGRWGRSLAAAAALRGFAETVVLTASRPTPLSLTAADFSNVTVVHGDSSGEIEVLLRGRRHVETPRTVAVRYWEERLFAHALAAGTIS